MAGTVAPMLAVSGALPPEDGSWLFEPKWDGVRALVTIDPDGRTTVRSRNDLDTTGSWPELVELGDTVPPDTVLDGEIVTLNAAGAPDFGLLQQRMHVRRPSAALQAEVPVVLMVFDLLRLAGQEVTALPLTERLDLLAGLPLGGAAQRSPSFDGPGPAVLEACMAQGMEGVVKRRSSPYLPGRRSPDWTKVKPLRRQEFVIAGWEPGQGAREGRLGALLLAVYDGDRLTYAGKVGTGFTDRTLADLKGELAAVASEASPLDGRPAGISREARWTRPELVCEVAFTGWTSEGRLRHPSYKGMRWDKPAGDVIREPG